MNRKMNIILIVILIAVTVWSLYNQNLYILVTNICIISGVLIDDYAGKMLMKKNTNIKFVKLIKKIVPILYFISAITLILWGYNKIHN